MLERQLPGRHPGLSSDTELNFISETASSHPGERQGGAASGEGEGDRGDLVAWQQMDRPEPAVTPAAQGHSSELRSERMGV